jgi:hypothetical protein
MTKPNLSGLGVEELTEEDLIETVKIWNANDKRIKPTAEAMEMSRNAVRGRLIKAAKQGFCDYVKSPALPGFRVSQVTVGPNGTSVQQKPDHGEQFQPLPGHETIGESALVDADGNVIVKWHKTKQGQLNPEDISARVQKAFEEWTPKKPTIYAPLDVRHDMLTAYIATDWHVGLMAWGKETGNPWSLDIARDKIDAANTELVDQTPPSKEALLIGLGDLIHTDGMKALTPGSGNMLDVDSRFQKMVGVCVELLANQVERLLTKHDTLKVELKNGNHDPAATVALRFALWGMFRNYDRIEVDISPNAYFWHEFGRNLIGGTHGDKAKRDDLPLVMATECREAWGRTKTQHVFTGHIHHDTLKEIGGVHVWSHRAPVAKDAFHHAEGYLSGQSVVAHNFHADRGWRGNTNVEID